MDAEANARRYLDLLKQCLTRAIFPLYAEPEERIPPGVQEWLDSLGARVIRATPVDPVERASGRDWPADAETMIGFARLDNIEHLIADVISRNIPGDLIETGVWRGGASIYMRAVLEAYGEPDRLVWVADSFQGLPKVVRAPGEEMQGDDLWKFRALAVSLEEVKANFERYGLLDERVRFLEGWFKDTLPVAPIDRLAIARLDGDLYESTMDALVALYPRISAGGYVIIDDYSIPQCVEAVEHYRGEHAIDAPMVEIDWTGRYWQKPN